MLVRDDLREQVKENWGMVVKMAQGGGDGGDGDDTTTIGNRKTDFHKEAI